MNINKLFLLSILTLSVATLYPQITTLENEFIDSFGNSHKYAIEEKHKSVTVPHKTTITDLEKTFWSDMYIGRTIMPGILVGGFTGTAIGYLSGTLFDAMLNKDAVQALIQAYGDNIPVKAIVALARLGAQVGSKFYWEKPLRNKIMNWLQNDMKQNGIECNEELMKTIARVSAWLGCASQISKNYYLPYNFLIVG